MQRSHLLQSKNEQRKAKWWLVRQAATVLREQFGIDRVGVIGDLVSPHPLNYWSEIQLVVWDIDWRSDMDTYKALSAVSKQPEICLLDAEKDYLTVDEREAIEQKLIAI